MDEIQTTDDLLAQEVAAEQDLATSVSDAVLLLQSESAQLTQLQKDFADLVAQQANGVIVPAATLNAWDEKLVASLARIKDQVTVLRTATAPPAPTPPTVTLPIPDGTVTGGTDGPPVTIPVVDGPTA